MYTVQTVESLLQHLLRIPPSQWIQLFFLLAAGGIVLLHALPRSLRDQLMEYGARADNSAQGDKATAKDDKNAIEKVLHGMIKVSRVPHSWFWHFYVLSVATSVFWAWQILTRGTVLKLIVERQAALLENTAAATEADRAANLGRLFVAWTMMFMQGSRRFYECMFVLKPGKSGMLVAHWALGLLFYAFIGVSLWIENSASVLDFWVTGCQANITSPRVAVSIAIFLYGWVNQYLCHKHLASLQKYTLPSEGLFRYLVCPHYTCECLIYLSLAIVSAPQGKLVNVTVLTGVLFVAVNLGATAIGTKEWSMAKFGKENVKRKWAMLPFIL
ncbi:hypothetical protein VHEMI05324 [[Torrubiella] hemipterigena]|uniref:Polyprenal reductase n=1 Tax=[Torrubiella] hemipterigena TaxID=1531966 RepID=A0A0A1T3S5_9HYPO|nr:hypothetical protein VHEMI05324 [[Torrubiella] hemipterigena]